MAGEVWTWPGNVVAHVAPWSQEWETEICVLVKLESNWVIDM